MNSYTRLITLKKPALLVALLLLTALVIFSSGTQAEDPLLPRASAESVGMILVEEGRLMLDEPLAEYIPEYAETTVAVLNGDEIIIQAANRQITIKDLLTHTSGIPGAEPELLVDQYTEASLTQTRPTTGDLHQKFGNIVYGAIISPVQ